MKKRKFLLATSLFACLGVALSSCQITPINAMTTITNTNGGGSKTLSAFMLVDGSCQIEPTLDVMEGNENYFYIDDVDFTNPTFTPKADGAKVNYIGDGYFTNPNGLTSAQAIWDEFNGVIESLIPEGFDFSLREIHSTGWDDSYMENIPSAEVTEWKAYVYSVSYSWEDVDDYIEKTKTLIGESYSFSHLKELEDQGTPWATFTRDEPGVYTWSEAYLVNYWSVYDIVARLFETEYYNNAPFGEDYAVTVDNAFTTALQRYKVGDGEEVNVLIDNLNGIDEQANPKFISATGTLVEPSDNTMWYVIAGVAAVVVIGGVALGLALRKKKKAK